MIGVLIEQFLTLSRDEQRAVASIVRRVYTARQKYGALHKATDPRAFKAEACEELLDATFYLAVDTLPGEESVEDEEQAAPVQAVEIKRTITRPAVVKEVAVEVEIKPPTRTCLDCPADISDRHGKATRCPKHAQEALRAQKRDSWRRRHGAVKAVKAAPPAPKAPQKRNGAAEEPASKKKRAPALIRDNSAKGKRSPDPVIEGMRAQLAKTVRKVDPIEEQARQSTTKRGGTPGRPGPRPASEVVAARDVGGTVML